MRIEIRRGAALAPLLLLLLAATSLAQDDIARHRFCGECGMDRKAYGFSRMLVSYEDGAEVGTCSLHCAAVELGKAPGRKVKSLLVADRDRTELVDAEKAIWVLGGRKRGVMTANPKWAFASREGAEAFVREHGGRIVPWPEAMEAARKEAK